jgi:Uma2 family endonuclease
VTSNSKPYPTKEDRNRQDETLVVKEPPAVYGLQNPVRYTYADYMAWIDDKRREIINGVAYDLFGAPARIHAEAAAPIFARFWNYVFKKKGKCKVYHAPFDVRFPKNGETADDKIYTVVQPDICVICDPKKLDDRGCIGAPDLVVEIHSPSTARRDMNEKLELYEEAGVKEYWVVFPKDRALTVFLLQPDGFYNPGTTYEYDAKVPVSIFKGLEIDLKELFED